MASITASTARSGITQLWGDLWGQLTEPAEALTVPAERRRARLQTALLLALIVLGSVALLISPGQRSSTNVTDDSLVIHIVLMLIPYCISRTKYYRFAAVLALLFLTTAILYPAFSATTSGRTILLQYVTLTVLTAGLLLEKRWVLVMVVLVLGGLMGIYLVDTADGSLSPFILTLATSVLLLVFLNHRDGLERDRQRELVAALDQAKMAVEAEVRTNEQLESKNQQLARANAMIKETTRLKSEFLSTMSHELRTPLNAIRGFTGILLEGMGGEIDEDARHMLTRVDANSERLLGLINDVLDIAKIEAGRMELVSEALNPHELASQWRSQMSILAQQKGIGFEVNVDPDLPDSIQGDSQRVTQVAINLLSNAFKFTKEGKVTLNVQREAENWVIRVKDTGIGIPPHALNYIFEEFRQVDGSSKREYGGTGLGLAITRTLCRTMGGSISVRSELGEGSEFTVTLPLNAQTQLEDVRLDSESL